MLIFEHKSKDIAPYLVYTNDDNFILDNYVYLVGYQNSGGDLTCSAGIELTRLA